jgi:hypothetical protein
MQEGKTAPTLTSAFQPFQRLVYIDILLPSSCVGFVCVLIKFYRHVSLKIQTHFSYSYWHMKQPIGVVNQVRVI